MKHAPVPIPGRAPESSVKCVNKDGESGFKINDFRGRYVLLVFYTADWECKDYLQAFDKLLDRFQKEKCDVFGCSTDSPKVHLNWLKACSEDGGFGGNLRFPLISDSTGVMSQKYDVYDPEEGVCRNAVVIIDDSGIVRHAMTTSLESQDIAANCLDILTMLKQHKLSDEEIRNISAASKKRESSSAARMDMKELEKAWDISNDPELNKVLNLARCLGKTAPPPPLPPAGEPKFAISNDRLARLVMPRVPLRACRAILYRNLAGFGLAELSTNQRMQVESLVKKIMVVSHMPEDLTGSYHPLTNLNQRQRINFFENELFYNSGDVRLREPGSNTFTEGSGVFVNNYENFLLWANCEQQLKLVAVENGGDFRSAVVRLKKAVENVEEAIKAVNGKGFNINQPQQRFVHKVKGVNGHGFDVRFLIELPGFVKDGESSLKTIASKSCLTINRYGRSGNTYEVGILQQDVDDINAMIARGLTGLVTIWQQEEQLRTKHNIKPSHLN